MEKNPNPVLGSITTLAANEHAIIASHDGKGILYSNNGITWLNIGDYTANSVSCQDGLFLSEDESSPVYSHDGVKWSPPNDSTIGTFTTDNAGAPTLVPNMQKVLKIGSHYLGLQNGRIHFSEALNGWTDVSPSDQYTKDIQVINGIAFAQDYGSITHMSGDGQNWIALEETFSDKFLSYSDGYYYALSNGSSANPQYTLLRSNNGIDWTPFGPVIMSNTYSPRFSHLVASPKGIVVASQFDESQLFLVDETSVELVNSYTNIASSGGENIKLVGPDGRFAISGNASFEIDGNGIWTPTKTLMERQTAYANGVYIGSWHFGEYRSYDGENWAQFSLPDWVLELDGADVHSLFSEGDSAIWAEISYRTISQYGYTQTEYLYIRTTDGLNWTRISSPDEDGIQNLFHLKGETFVINPWEENPTLYKFDDANGTWTSSAISIDRGYNFAQTRDYIATSVATKIFVTNDGQNWSTYDLPVAEYSSLIATDDAFYLISNQVWKSNNGKDWEVILPYQLKASAEGNRIIFYDDNYQIIETSFNDLAIVDATVSSKEYAVGDPIEIQTTLSNRGTSALTWPANSDLAFTFSNSAESWTLATPDSGFSGTTPIPFTTLEPGESKQITFTVTVPNSIDPDSYFLSLYISDELIPKDGNVSNDYFTQTEATPIIIPSRTLTIPSPENGSISGIGISKEYAWKEKVNLSAVPDFGYQFDGWVGDLTYAEESLLVSLDNDISLEANFSPKTLSVELTIKGNGTVTGLPESESIKFGENLDLTATPAEGWKFIRWEGYGQTSSNTLNAKVGRNLSLSAQFGVLFSDWAKTKYGDAPELIAPDSDPDGDGVSNMEHYAFGLDYPEQRASANLGVRREGNVLILRYAVYRGLFEFAVTPVWTNDSTIWYSTAQTEVGETADLTIHEAQLPLEGLKDTKLLSIRISAIDSQ